jgi:hypothetical protein
VALWAYKAGCELGMPKERVLQVVKEVTTGNIVYAADLAHKYLEMPIEMMKTIQKEYLGIDEENAFTIGDNIPVTKTLTTTKEIRAKCMECSNGSYYLLTC